MKQTLVEPTKTEIIAISSGKGGTGKTIIAASLGFALTRAGHRVLMIDGDPGTDGLSLFLLGPRGMEQLEEFGQENTFVGFLERYNLNKKIYFKPREINRTNDHAGTIYSALVSGRGIYGNKYRLKSVSRQRSEQDLVVPRLARNVYQDALRDLFHQLRQEGKYDYVLVDTRGGFAFESTNICALADSFIVVTEPDATSFYQDRNLVEWINKDVQMLQGSDKLEKPPLLRAIIVNKATKGEEQEFRILLEREFKGIRWSSDTFPVPLDVNAITSYRSQLVPYINAPDSEFSAATLKAFSSIMRLVTAGWAHERIDAWNKLVDDVSEPYRQKHGLWQSYIGFLKRNITTLIFVVILVAAWLGYTFYQQQQLGVVDQQVQIVYAVDQAQAVRISNLFDLVAQGYLDFNGVDLTGADLSGTNLASLQLRRAGLSGANLSNANLSGANLQGADLSGANLIGANLDNADLRDANLSGAIIDRAQLESAVIDDNTILQVSVTDTPAATITPTSTPTPTGTPRFTATSISTRTGTSVPERIPTEPEGSGLLLTPKP